MAKRVVFIPPSIALATLVIQSAATGFPALNNLFCPVVLSAAAILSAAALSKKYSPESLFFAAKHFLLWSGWGFAAGYFWKTYAIAHPEMVGSMMPSFIGLDNVTSSAWMKMLLAGSGSTLLAGVAARAKCGIRIAGAGIVGLALLLLTISSLFSWKAAVSVVRGRKIDHVFLADGNVEQLPFHFSVMGFEAKSPDPPEILKAVDLKGNTVFKRALIGPCSIKLPGGESVLNVLEERINGSVERTLVLKSNDYLSPAIGVLEFAEDGTSGNKHLLFGLPGRKGAAYLEHSGMPVYYSHCAEKEDFNLLSASNLQYLPRVEVQLKGVQGLFLLPAIGGRDLAIQKTHYKIEITKAFAGDLLSGEKGWVQVALFGPRGTDTLRLSEDNISDEFRKYSGCRVNYIHPRVQGEPEDFFRLVSAEGVPLSRTLFLEANRVPEDADSTLEEFRAGGIRLSISHVFGEAKVSERLFSDDDGRSCLQLELVRNGEERKKLTLSQESYYPVELPREELALSLHPVFQEELGKVELLFAAEGYPEETVYISTTLPCVFEDYSLSVIGYDKLLGNSVTIAIARTPWLPWLLVLLSIGVALLGFDAVAWILRKLEVAGAAAINTAAKGAE